MVPLGDSPGYRAHPAWCLTCLPGGAEAQGIPRLWAPILSLADALAVSGASREAARMFRRALELGCNLPEALRGDVMRAADANDRRASGH